MFDLVILVIMGFTSAPLDLPVEQCSYSQKQLCCTWQYEEVGCVEEFTVQEEYCISRQSDYTWELSDMPKFISDKTETWHDRYVRDHCAACPECCVTLEDGDDEE